MDRFGVSHAKSQALTALMERVGLRESDIEERFIRSRGPGGQNVNKVSTCVRLRHRPSGVVVRVQRERTQALNRFFARRLLAQKLENIRLGRLSAQRRRIEKIRRQKRRRSRRAKEKMLQIKKKRSQVKQLRQKPQSDD